MAVLLFSLLLADDPAAVKVPEAVKFLEAKDIPSALLILKELAGMKGNDDEAKALVRLVRSTEPARPAEILEACFLALKGIGSRAVTKELLALLKLVPLRKNPAVRIGICRALEGSEDPAGVEAISELIGDPDDRVAAAAAEAAAVHRHARETVRKGLFEQILNIYESTWNRKNAVDPALKAEQSRAERKWEVIEKPMERCMQLLSNVTQNDPAAWRRFWNKNKNKPWGAPPG